MTQSPPTGELVARLRAMNPWKDMDWPEVVRDAADRLDAITTIERELARKNQTFCAMLSTGVCDLPERLTASQAEVERLKEALTNQAEEFAQIAERDTDWTLFSRQSKVEPLTGAETNVFAGPEDDGTYPTAKNVFAYTTGIAAGRAIAAAIRQRVAIQVEESKG